MRTHLEVRSFAAAALLWTATSAIAGPVIYAAADRATSKGTELYVIDPIAATITMVRGMGIGAGGGGMYGGAYAGGGYGSTSSGAGGTGGGLTAGDFSHFAPASLSGSLFRGSAPVATHSSDDPITAAELITPSNETIDTAPLRTSMPAWLGAQPSSFGGGSGRKSAGTSSPQFSPSIGCGSDCDELAEHTSGRSLRPASPGIGCAGDCSEREEYTSGRSLVAVSPGIGCTDDCGHVADTPSLGSLLSLSPGIGCRGDCKDLSEDALFAPGLISSCIANCGEGVSSLAVGGLQISAVPEPSLLGLLGVGFATAGWARRRKTLKP